MQKIESFLQLTAAIAMVSVCAACSGLHAGEDAPANSTRPVQMSSDNGAMKDPAAISVKAPTSSDPTAAATTTRRPPDNSAGLSLPQSAAATVGDSVPPSIATTAAPSFLRTVQQRLNEMGYNAGAVDGVLGPHTRRALRKFQSDRGLRANGDPDPATTAALGIIRPYDSTPLGSNTTADDSLASEREQGPNA